MSGLPFVFASLTSATLSMLDANFNFLGAMTPTPCSVAGTNTLTLTPNANAVNVTVYANYAIYTGIAANNNSGAVTAQIAALASLPVYKDTGSGPVALSGGEIIAKTAFQLMYDSTLNTGSGGFHLLSSVISGSFLPISGGTLSGALSVTTSITASGGIFGATGTVTGLFKAASLNVTGAISGVNETLTGNLQASTGSIQGLLSGVSATFSGALQAGLVIGSALIAGQATNPSVTRILTSTATITFASITPLTSSDQTVALVGCSVGDLALLSPPASPTVGLDMSAFVSASGSVVIRALNGTSLTLTPPAGVYRVGVIGFT